MAKLEKLIKVSKKATESGDIKDFMYDPENAGKLMKHLPAIESSVPAELIAVLISIPAMKGLKKALKDGEEQYAETKIGKKFKDAKKTVGSLVDFLEANKPESEGFQDKLKDIIVQLKSDAEALNKALKAAEAENCSDYEEEENFYPSEDDYQSDESASTDESYGSAGY